VYCFLRRSGLNEDKARDLTQGFFSDVLLGRDLIAQANRTRGKFRTFLLAALRHYAIDLHRRDGAEIRAPGKPQLNLDDLEATVSSLRQLTPEEAFVHAWAADLLDEVMKEVRDSFAAEGKGTHWTVFEERCLRPILDGTPGPPVPAVGSRMGLPDPKTASNMMVTVKRRLAEAFRQRIRAWVASEEQVEEEIGELMEILSKPGAPPPPTVPDGGG
jgi:RNA polymerase sigma-70 factor (ECF subfamily)